MPIDLSTLDPNLMYLALVAGLWVGVTAVYIPGTFLPELGAMVLIVGSLIALMAMPTNWLALVILVLGVSAFLLLPLFGERYGRFAEVGLVGQSVGGYFLFTELSVSPILIAVTVLLGLLYNRAVLIPTMRNQRKWNEYDESNQVVGVRGRVVSDLDPVGTVYVNKELWRARSTQRLETDTPIMVIEQDGLELLVEKTKNEDRPSYMSEAQEMVDKN